MAPAVKLNKEFEVKMPNGMQPFVPASSASPIGDVSSFLPANGGTNRPRGVELGAGLGDSQLGIRPKSNNFPAETKRYNASREQAVMGSLSSPNAQPAAPTNTIGGAVRRKQLDPALQNEVAQNFLKMQQVMPEMQNYQNAEESFGRNFEALKGAGMSDDDARHELYKRGTRAVDLDSLQKTKESDWMKSLSPQEQRQVQQELNNAYVKKGMSVRDSKTPLTKEFKAEIAALPSVARKFAEQNPDAYNAAKKNWETGNATMRDMWIVGQRSTSDGKFTGKRDFIRKGDQRMIAGRRGVALDSETNLREVKETYADRLSEHNNQRRQAITLESDRKALVGLEQSEVSNARRSETLQHYQGLLAQNDAAIAAINAKEKPSKKDDIEIARLEQERNGIMSQAAPLLYGGGVGGMDPAQVAVAEQWAKANPTDPRSAQILSKINRR